MDDYSFLDAKPPVQKTTSGQTNKNSGFSIRDNSTINKFGWGTASDSKRNVIGGKENSTIKKDERFFSHSHSTSGPRLEAMKDMGSKIKSNSTLMSKMGIQGTEGVKQFVARTVGKSPFCQAATARKDWDYLDRGKVENTSFYKNLPARQQDKLRNDRDAQRHLRDVFGGMLGKK